jgi:hypothetical protein
MDPDCALCDGAGWVCENHQDRPWAPESERFDACGCGAGAPCPKCNAPSDVINVPETSRIITDGLVVDDDAAEALGEPGSVTKN